MSEQFEHNPGDHDDPVGDSTWAIGIGGAFVLTVLVISVAVLFYRADSELIDERVVREMPKEYLDLQKQWDEQLVNWGTAPVVDDEGNPVMDANGKPAKRIHIPVRNAMELIVKESGKGPVASAGGHER